MHQLNNPILLEQCARIKAMIEEVACTPKYQNNYYASLYHHWKLSPTVRLEDIEKFEETEGITLPDEYVYYLTQIGAGGASPGTGLIEFPNLNYEPDTISDISEQLSFILSKMEWDNLYGEKGHSVPEPGVICLCAMDLTYEAYLIVTGPNRGKVVYMDYDGECAPIWPKGSSDFLSWYENFFSELLAGYNISPTWRFMWQEPGNTQALICAFQNTESKEYHKEVLYSFCKFKELSEEAYQFLENLQKSELKKEAEDVLKQFPSIKRKKKRKFK